MTPAAALPGIPVAILLLFLLMTAGCGTTNDAALPGQQEQIDSQPLAEAGAAPVEEGVLTAEDLSLGEGSVSVFSAGSTTSAADVDFDLEGPWDFRRGPEAFTLTMETVAREDAPFAENFPDASVAVHYSWKPSMMEAKYSFQSMDTDAWRAYGESGSTRMITYSSPSRALLFPAGVGDQWTETYDKTEGNSTTSIVVENRIVSQNRLQVPAGEYDAYLLQSHITATRDQQSVTTWDYVWLVPGVGRAAEIVSLPGEEEELFDRAYAFYRLESFEEA